MIRFFQEFLELMGNNPAVTGINHHNLIESVDGILVKKLKQTNTLAYGRDSHQTHIAMTGNEMYMFPWEAAGNNIVDLRCDNRFKKNYVVRINVIILENNINYLRDYCYDRNICNIINSFTHTARTERADGTIQTEVSYLSLDDNDFLNLRSAFREGDYLVFLRKRDIQEYLCLGISSRQRNVPTGVQYF